MPKPVSAEVFLLDAVEWFVDTVNPQVAPGVAAPVGSWLIRANTSTWYVKVGPGDTEWLPFGEGGSSGWYSTGADGDVTLPGGTTTLTRDMFYRMLVVPNGAILEPRGWRVFATVAIIVESGGLIRSNGGNASGSSAGSAATMSGEVGGGSGSGGAGSTTNGGNGTTISNAMLGYPPRGRGGSGGAGANGTGGTPTLNTVTTATKGRSYDAATLINATLPSGTGNYGTATGGGGGGGNGTGLPGGGGGGGAGRIVLASPVIQNRGTIQCRGGNGASPPSGGNAGGGGGGGGGQVWAITRDWSGNAPDVSGGTGAAGSGTGGNGQDGNAGEWVVVSA